MKYDDAEYYFMDFVTDLPNENGGRHMGLFLEWAIHRGLAGDELMTEAEALRIGRRTGLDLLFEYCDGKLFDTDLNDEGNAFAADYYEAHHLDDFIEAMNVSPDEATADAVFGAQITPQRHARVLWQLDRRYSDWRRTFGLLSKDALLERFVETIAPVAEAVGFKRTTVNTGTVEVGQVFERCGAWGRQTLYVIAVDHPQWFHGVRVECSVDLDALYETIVAEKTLDMGMVTSLQNSAEIHFSRLAEGWEGPLRDYLWRDCGFWIFRNEDIAPLATWLATRLRTFALPTLRDLDCVDALALAYGTRPMSASPIYDARDPYAVLLSAEQARHPRLGAMLVETENAIRAIDPDAQTYDQQGALRLIERIRARSKHRL